MKLKLDRCRTCKGVNFYEFDGDGLGGHFPVVWCGDCGTLHKHYFGDTDWTCMSPGPKTDAACTCRFIQNDDPTRHFRGCPLREKYPTHEAEGRDVRLRVAEKMVQERLEDYEQLMLMIDAAGFTVASGKLEPKTRKRCQDYEVNNPERQCTLAEGHAGLHMLEPISFISEANAWASADKAPPGAVPLKMPEPTVFEYELEAHRKGMQDDMARDIGQSSDEVRRLRQAVWFLLAVAHQP